MALRLLSVASCALLLFTKETSASFRTESVDKEGLLCEIGKPHEGTAEIERYEIPFYYALGTTADGEMDFMEIHQLGQALYKEIVHNHIAWCYKEEEKAVPLDAGGGERRHRLMEAARQLGILSIGPGGTFDNQGACLPVCVSLSVCGLVTDSLPSCTYI